MKNFFFSSIGISFRQVFPCMIFSLEISLRDIYILFLSEITHIPPSKVKWSAPECFIIFKGVKRYFDTLEVAWNFLKL